MKSGCSAVERRRRVLGRRARHHLLPAHVALLDHRHRLLGARDDEDLLDGAAAVSSAASTVALSGTTLPRRQPPSAVMMSLQPASLTRSRIAVSEKPPKMTECVAPMRAQASSEIASSGIIGR